MNRVWGRGMRHGQFGPVNMFSFVVGCVSGTFTPFSPQNKMPAANAETFNLYKVPKIKRLMLWNESGVLALKAPLYFPMGD